MLLQENCLWCCDAKLGKIPMSKQKFPLISYTRWAKLGLEIWWSERNAESYLLRAILRVYKHCYFADDLCNFGSHPLILSRYQHCQWTQSQQVQFKYKYKYKGGCLFKWNKNYATIYNKKKRCQNSKYIQINSFGTMLLQEDFCSAVM